MSLWPYQRPGEASRARLASRFERTLDALVLHEELARATAAGALDDLRLDAVSATSLDFKKDRFIVLVEGGLPGGGAVRLIAKGYADDRAPLVHANHLALWRAGLADPPIRTSRPYGTVPALGLTITEHLPGRHPTATDHRMADLCAVAAAALHRCGASLQPRFTLEAALGNVHRHASSLERRVPDAGPLVRALAERAERVGGSLGPLPMAPVHGDMSLGSFLLTDDATAMLDWDISCLFDPAWDVGHYTTQLLRFELETGLKGGGSAGAFVARYREAAGVDSSFDTRLDFFVALACVHKAYRVQRVARPDAPTVLAALLREAGERLARVG